MLSMIIRAQLENDSCVTDNVPALYWSIVESGGYDDSDEKAMKLISNYAAL
jgi:hypothetical protein